MTVMRTKIRFLAAAAALCAPALLNAEILNIKSTLELALQNDPEWSAIKHQYAADKEIIPQAQSGLLPNLSLSAQTAEETTEPDGQDKDSYHSESYTASLQQPLLHLDAWHGYKQAKAIDQQYDAGLKVEEQNFYLRVLETYLNVLRAKENLAFRKAEEKSIERQLEQTTQRHEVGLIAKTDVHEAQAAFDVSVVQRIIANRDLVLALQNIETLTGTPVTDVANLVSGFPISPPTPEAPNHWTELALKQNYSLIAARQGETSAEQNYKVLRSKHLPTIDLVGSYSKSNSDLESVFNTGSNNAKRSSIALQLNVPIYSGGYTSANRRQAKELHFKSQDDKRAAERNIVSATSNLLRVVQTNVQEVAAQKQVIKSAESALEASQAGYEAGTRTIVDVLNTQRTLFSAKKDYANARFNFILNSAQLEELVGTLTGEDLVELNRWLAP